MFVKGCLWIYACVSVCGQGECGVCPNHQHPVKKCPATHGTQLKTHWTVLERIMAFSPEHGQNLIYAI